MNPRAQGERHEDGADSAEQAKNHKNDDVNLVDAAHDGAAVAGYVDFVGLVERAPVDLCTQLMTDAIVEFGDSVDQHKPHDPGRHCCAGEQQGELPANILRITHA